MTGRPVFLHLIDELRMGGAQTHLHTILREDLKTSQFQHLVVSLFGEGVVADSLRELGVEVIILDLAGAITRHEYFSVQEQLYQLILQKKPVIVEAHLTYSRLLGLFAAWRAGVSKRIGFEQGDIYFNSWKWRLANFIGQFFAKKIIACSEALKFWVQKTHFVSSQRIAVFYNCVDPLLFKPSLVPTITRTSLNISPEAFVFCAVGTLGKGVNKRLDICIQALAQISKLHPETQLLICGDGPQRPELEELTKKLDLSHRVKFLGFRKDVPDVMAMSNAFCHAAPFEPFGIVCIEAMLLGLPVIIPDSGGITEIVEHGVTGLKYEALHSTDFSSKMSALISNPELAKKMSQAGRERVLNTMTVEKYVHDLRKLYEVV